MANETQILLTILAGTSVMFGLVLSIVLFVVMYNRKLKAKEADYQFELMSKEMDVLRAVINTEESERDKIARNLHDEVGPMITSLKLKLTKHQRDLDKGKLSSSALNEDRELIDEVMDNIRTVSHDLSPQFLRKQGLIQALKSYVSNLEGVKISVVTDLDGDQELLGTIALNAYRIVLEIINNIFKHDRPKELKLEIKKTLNKLTIRIQHDGEGISNKDFVRLVESGNGLGLDSLRSRTIVLGAELDYQTGPAQITLHIPLDVKED